jgi:hypothetical protein
MVKNGAKRVRAGPWPGWGRVALAAMAAALACASVGAAAGGPTVDWRVVASGGGSATAGNVSLSGTVGQWATGSGTAGTTVLSSGFWGGSAGESFVYLPLVLRNA